MKTFYKRIILFFLFFIGQKISFCQTSYTWSGGSSGDYQVGSNWTPTRTTASTSDVLIFNNSATVTNVPTQSISQLKLGNNSVVSLQAQSGGSRTLTVGINDPSGDDIEVPVGCELILAQNTSGVTGETLTLQLTSTQPGATANISGVLSINKNTGTSFNNVFNVANGTTTISGTVNNAGSLSNATTTTLIFSDGATYNHLRDNGVFPSGGNFTGANINVIGYVTGAISNFPFSIKSLTWDCTSQATNITAILSSSTLVSSSTSLAISGDVNILSTGSGAGALVFNLSTVVIGGNMLISANGFDFSRVATGNTSNFTVTGNLTINNANTRNVNGLAQTASTPSGTVNLTVTDFIQTGAGNFVMANANASGGTFNLIVKGNFNKSAGTFTTTSTTGITGNVVFSGTSSQTISTNAAFSNRPNIEINNPTGVTLNTALTSSGILKLTSGILNTSVSNILTIPSTGSIIGGSNTSFISGPVNVTRNSTSSFTIPLGKVNKYRSIQITPDATASTSYRFEYFNTGYSNTTNITSPILQVSAQEYYDITRTAGTANLTFTLPYEFNAGTVSNTSDLAVARFDGSSWISASTNPIVSGNTTSGTLTIQAPASTFGLFTIGFTNLPTLPVKIESFNAILRNQTIELKWVTAEEKNTQVFEVEKYMNGVWGKIGEVRAVGGGVNLFTYRYADNSVLRENIYRLKIIDNDGYYEYSEMVSVNALISSDLQQVTLYPNPVVGKRLHVQLSSKLNYPMLYSIINNQGQYVSSGSLREASEEIELNLPSGVYILLIENHSQTKLIVE